jgi:hypothetical protein
MQFLPTAGLGYLDYPMLPETGDHRYFSFLRKDLMLLVKYATAKVACKTADWGYGNRAPLGLGDMSEAGGAIPGTSFGVLRHPLQHNTKCPDAKIRRSQHLPQYHISDCTKSERLPVNAKSAR